MRQNFYTLRGYDQMDKRALSAAMEDYLEMIYRHQSQQLAVRIGQLAERLHVQPPAASKIVKRLSDAGYVYPPDAQRAGKWARICSSVTRRSTVSSACSTKANRNWNWWKKSSTSWIGAL